MSYYSAFNEFKELMEYRLQSSSVYATPHLTVTCHSQSSIQQNNVFQPCTNNLMPTNHTLMPSSSESLSNLNHTLTPSSSESLPNLCPLSLAAVKFREIPFYEPMHVLLQPSVPVPSPFSTCQTQESIFTFHLSRKEVRDIACNHECQILLRFCKFDTETEQNDCFPPNLAVKVNQQPLPLEVAVAMHTKKPLLITPFTKISSTKSNEVIVSWSLSYTQSYAMTAYIAKPISSYSLYLKLKSNAVKKSHLTTSLVIDKIKEERDLDIAVRSIKVSLLCPLGKSKMESPCRATTCSHVACFDASLYINLQRNKDKWKWLCPVCDKLALYENLEIDELFMSIISKVPRDCTEVEFFENGSWAPVMPESPFKEVPLFFPEASKSVEVIDISSDSDTDDQIKVD